MWFQLLCASKDDQPADGPESYKHFSPGSDPRIMSLRTRRDEAEETSGHFRYSLLITIDFHESVSLPATIVPDWMFHLQKP